MYLDCEIKIPVVPGRINQIKKGKTTYIRYVLKRTYHADKKYNVPEQKVIGKRSETSSEPLCVRIVVSERQLLLW